jgi:heterodisulfide reductase subunit A-like polyferredoxin
MNSDKIKKTGAVLVQGGGMAGVQASLDLANSGFKVYLVERNAAIGGIMAHLDKTFPTGDCATCIGSPKLVECARNINIRILTLSELVKLEGKAGNFKAFVKRHPRYVDEDICNGCSECEQVCPVDIPDHFDRELGTRKAIAKYYDQATPNIYGILKNGHAPCKIACPANVNVQGYIQLIRKKEYIKAVNLIRERIPFSAICGRICTHPCETACIRGRIESPVAIRLLKRFASDKEIEMLKSGKLKLPEEKTPPKNAKKVAVIGAGPAGLTAANDLAARGFAVTIYEALDKPGGMLQYGIPEYRLPREILMHEIELIRRKGVSFKFNCKVGKDITFDKLQSDYDAVFISTGAHKSHTLGVEGEQNDGIDYGIEFLRQAHSGNNMPRVRDKVVVIGGGNVAVDVARTALRLGAKHVEMVSLEQLNEMPAYPEEIQATLKEGIIIRNGWGPCRITGNGSVTGIELKLCTSVFNSTGQFAPVYDESKLTKIQAEQIIIAIGQTADKKFMEHINAQTRQDCFKIDPVTHETSIKGVFAGGDNVTGPASVIEAIASGKRAAESIEKYLNDEDMLSGRFEDSLKPVPEELLPQTKSIEKESRAVPDELDIKERIKSFNEVETGLTEEAALAEAERCLNCALCSECGECVIACKQHAINHQMTEQLIQLDVGSVILAPGFEEFMAGQNGEFGFNRYENVLTSMQFERMLSAAGPYKGHLVRPSDGQSATRIAWIQCVGSRSLRCGNEYCSSICCMATIKQAMIAGEHVNGLSATIFYMDIRAYGKDFDQYYERCKAMDNIKYIKSIPSRIIQVPDTMDLRLCFINENRKYTEQEFDLVVLAVGIDPKSSVTENIKQLGIDTNEFGFCKTDRLLPIATSRPGVFVAGAFQEPKDIPETVMQGSAASSMAMELLASARNTLVTKKDYPQEHDVTDEEPRIGIFVCHCGMNIASVVNVEKVVNAVRDLPDVVFATDSMFTCSDTSLVNIKEMIREHRLNRVVVASCTPHTHEPLFRETLREAGLNPYLFELANIRDQCSWVHSAYPEIATEKAIDLVKISVARASRLSPLGGEFISVNQNALIIGGGVSGMTAALALAEQGFYVDLIEKNAALGGNLLNINSTLEHENLNAFKTKLIDAVSNHNKINIHLETEMSAINGHIGNFIVTLQNKKARTEVQCGAIIVASGAKPAATNEFLYGKAENVITQVELENQLREKKFNKGSQNIVMIQCVGSRNDEKPYCSRICCSMAIKNALRIKDINKIARIYILYRDIRTYGFRESYYKKAREQGIIFIRYEKEKPPIVSEKNGILDSVTVDSPDYPETIKIMADKLVLSTGIDACDDNASVSDMLKVPLNSDGFYAEAHMKLRPVDFTTEGIFLCGLAHSPKFLDENISQAKAAASRAATVLSKTHLEIGAQVSVVDQDKCISCMTCVKSCPYNAPYCNYDNKAEIAGAKCMGCGICASECPARAIYLYHYRSDYFNIMIDKLFEPAVE